MIRPSALQIAEKCGMAPKLAVDFPETSIAADRGTGIHDEIKEAIRTGAAPKSPEARAALRWLAEAGKGTVIAEEKLELHDPETGEVITEGTPDVVVLPPGGGVMVVDWKTGRPENVAEVDDNLQIMAYAVAASIRHNQEPAWGALVFLDGDRADPRVMARRLGSADLWNVLDRVRAAAGRKPEASPGPHCAGCWQRRVCASYRERTALALTLLPSPGPTDLALTDQQATDLVLRAKAVREACDLAEDLAKAHVQNGGRVEADGKRWGPHTVAGRRSGPSVKDLEAQGLGHLVKPGAPSTRWEWRKAG